MGRLRSFLFVIFSALMLVGCTNSDKDAEQVLSSSDDDQSNSSLHELLDEIERLNAELDAAVEKLNELYEKVEHFEMTTVETPTINMFTSAFMNNLKEKQIENLNNLASSKIEFVLKDAEIYAVYGNQEVKLTYFTENHILYSWFTESTEINEGGTQANVIVRLDYKDENGESVKEDRYFSITFMKELDDWLIDEISN